jgi:hypothetical protein
VRVCPGKWDTTHLHYLHLHLNQPITGTDKPHRSTPSSRDALLSPRPTGTDRKVAVRWVRSRPGRERSQPGRSQVAARSRQVGRGERSLFESLYIYIYSCYIYVYVTSHYIYIYIVCIVCPQPQLPVNPSAPSHPCWWGLGIHVDSKKLKSKITPVGEGGHH